MTKCLSCPSPAEADRKKCLPCLVRARARVKKWQEKHPERHRAKSRAAHDRYRAVGTCLYGCGQPRHWSNRNYCLRHSAAQSGRRSHGVGFDRRMVMYENQGGACFICGAYEPDPVALHVDHCHATSEVRGLLCGDCNRGVGGFKDNPRLLLRAATYLEKGN